MWTFSDVGSRIIRTLRIFFLDPYFLAYCLSWIIVRYSRTAGNPIPFVNNWLTDLVFIPLIAHFAFCLGFLLLDLKKGFSFPMAQLFALAFMCSIFFEYLSPKFTDYNTADIFDVCCYFLGALFYYFVHQPFNNRKLTKEEASLPTATSSATTGGSTAKGTTT